jgi:hypothetical protein
VRQCSEVVNAVNSDATETEIFLLKKDLREQSCKVLDVCKWLGKADCDTSSDSLFETVKDSFNIENNVEAYSMDLQTLSKDYENNLANLDKRRMLVKTAVDREIVVISELATETERIFESTLTNGCGLLKNLISRNRLDIMEIVSIESEMNEWLELVRCLQEPEKIRVKCEMLLVENAAKEENLLILEDERIDIRSTLEKASLKRARKSNISNSLNSTSEDGGGATLVEIKTKLSVAEKTVKDARRDMREWYRVVREFAGGFAPELFHMLPDLQAAGSLLGDGGI